MSLLCSPFLQDGGKRLYSLSSSTWVAPRSRGHLRMSDPSNASMRLTSSLKPSAGWKSDRGPSSSTCSHSTRFPDGWNSTSKSLGRTASTSPEGCGLVLVRRKSEAFTFPKSSWAEWPERTTRLRLETRLENRSLPSRSSLALRRGPIGPGEECFV
jgi:hypothetical protein